MNVKTKEVELFGRKFLISERNAGDVLSSIQLIKSKPQSGQDYSAIVFNALVILEQALKINITSLKWYNIIKKFKYKRMLSKKYLLDNLNAKYIFELSVQVYELEGLKVESKTSVSEGDKKKEN